MKLDEQPIEANAWNTALDQATRALGTRAREIRQRDGMYYRALTGLDSDA